MNTYMLPAFLLVCIAALNGVEAIKCKSCDDSTLNGAVNSTTPCAGALSIECLAPATSCATFCYKITGMKDGEEMVLVVSESDCGDKVPDGVTLPDSECATSIEPINAMVATWDETTVVYSNACGCKEDDCNNADQVANCSAYQEPKGDECIDDKACAHGTCGGTADEPKCDCDYSYTGDLCDEAITTGDVCVRSCAEKVDGKYQSCTTCEKYVNCTSKALTEVACPANMKWDNDKTACANTTATCEKKTSGSSRITFTVFWLMILTVFYMGK